MWLSVYGFEMQKGRKRYASSPSLIVVVGWLLFPVLILNVVLAAFTPPN
jgi:hypothetical protein